MKRILVISYSQTGQLDSILDNFLKPFEGVEIDRVKIQPQQEYAFPWASGVFFDAMPESVLEQPIPLAPYQLSATSYDLIILGYQPWYLSPSLPITSLLQDSKFLSIVKNTPIVTVIGARNMWINAQKSIVQRLQAAGGKMVANIPLIDRHQNLISAFTIMHWLMAGKKDRKWGFLPYPGVSDEDINGAHTLGKPVFEALQKGDYKGLQTIVLAQQKIDLHTSIMFIESKAKRLFHIWANLIKRKGTNEKKRAFWVNIYKYYLLVALFIVSPIILTFYNILVKPFTGASIRKNKEALLYMGIDK